MITQVLSPTTYAIEYEGRKYRRSVGELRKYKATASSADVLAALEQENLAQDMKAGDMVVVR